MQKMGNNSFWKVVQEKAYGHISSYLPFTK